MDPRFRPSRLSGSLEGTHPQVATTSKVHGAVQKLTPDHHIWPKAGRSGLHQRRSPVRADFLVSASTAPERKVLHY
jgi:hypothetical protein